MVGLADIVPPSTIIVMLNSNQAASISIHHIFTLLEFCFKNTYFLFQGRYYEQVYGAAMGSPMS